MSSILNLRSLLALVLIMLTGALQPALAIPSRVVVTQPQAAVQSQFGAENIQWRGDRRRGDGYYLQRRTFPGRRYYNPGWNGFRDNRYFRPNYGYRNYGYREFGGYRNRGWNNGWYGGNRYYYRHRRGW